MNTLRDARRRVLAGIVAIGIASTILVGCGSDAPSPTEQGQESYTVGVTFYNENIPLYAQMKQGLEERAAESGVELIVQDAGNSAQVQTDQIQNFISRQVDAIIAAPQDADALVPAYRDAQSSGIPVFSVGAKVNDESVESAYIGPDLVELAAETMQQVIEAIGGSGDIILLSGAPQATITQTQKEGFDPILVANPGINVVDEQVVPDLAKATAVDVATAALTGHPDAAAIVAANDQVALGAWQAAEALGRAPGDVFISAWNLSPEMLTALQKNEVQLTLSTRGVTWGTTAIDTVVAWLGGTKPTAHRVETATTFVTSETVGDQTLDDLD